MRTLRLQSKDRVTVPIPDDFSLFLSNVHELILKNDESVIHESDDLLQYENAYGGLVEEGGSEFGFTFFPEEGIRVKWEILLDKDDIAKIANGEQHNLILWRCKDPECRSAFYSAKESCFYCDWLDGD